MKINHEIKSLQRSDIFGISVEGVKKILRNAGKAVSIKGNLPGKLQRNKLLNTGRNTD